MIRVDQNRSARHIFSPRSLPHRLHRCGNQRYFVACMSARQHKNTTLSTYACQQPASRWRAPAAFAITGIAEGIYCITVHDVRAPTHVEPTEKRLLCQTQQTHGRCRTPRFARPVKCYIDGTPVIAQSGIANIWLSFHRQA